MKSTHVWILGAAMGLTVLAAPADAGDFSLGINIGGDRAYYVDDYQTYYRPSYTYVRPYYSDVVVYRDPGPRVVYRGGCGPRVIVSDPCYGGPAYYSSPRYYSRGVHVGHHRGHGSHGGRVYYKR